MKKYHYASIADYNKAQGFPPPEQPLLCVSRVSAKQGSSLACTSDEELVISTDFYSISIKQIIAGEIFYGRTKYDCRNGTMIFTAPEQELRIRGVKVKADGRFIQFHRDYIRGHPIQAQIKNYHFFDYAIHEALHLSPKEEQQIAGLFDAIEAEYHNNQDEFTR